MKVLLLGGTGTLSFEVLKCSIQHKYTTAILNRGRNNTNIDKDVVCVYIADLNFPTTIDTILGKETFDVIVDFYSRNKENIQSLFPILSKRCTQYIFISSACVYCRNNESIDALCENCDKPNRLWAYSIHKYEAEQCLVEMSKQYDCYYTIVRPYITYNDERIPWGIAPVYRFHRTIIERIKSGKPMFVWDGGLNYCTLTYCEDFAKALVGLFLNPKAMNDDFHITSDYCYQWKEVLISIYKELRLAPNIVNLPLSLITKYLPEYKDELVGDRSLNAIFNNKKIKEAIPGFFFQTSLDEGIKKVVKHYETLPTFSYDFRYDARIDRMLSKCGVNDLRFVSYPHCSRTSGKVYFIYRNLPLRIANRLYSTLKKYEQ